MFAKTNLLPPLGGSQINAQKKTEETLSASLEDYLEAIHLTLEAKQAVRAKDITARLCVSKSSVTGALRALAEKGLLNYAPYDVITLTLKGRIAAAQISGRHEILKDFLVKALGIGESEAEAAACKAEHALSDAILERFGEFTEFLEQFRGGRNKFLEKFRRYCESKETTAD